jgi:hypothetical protein
MKDVVTASFTGDDVKVSIDVQNGRGPFAPSLNQGFIQVLKFAKRPHFGENEISLIDWRSLGPAPPPSPKK